MLRALNTLPLAIFAAAAVAAAAGENSADTDNAHEQEDSAAPMQSFAEGAQGAVGVDVPGLMARIEALKTQLLGDLDIQLPTKLDDDLGIGAIVDQALSDGPAHDLLGVGPGYGASAEAGERYGGSYGFVFVSFSLPETSLRQLMQEADQLGIPIVLRGFVGDSVFETQTALERVFIEAEATPGFLIDPTLYEKFAINHVPSMVVMPKHAATCISDACFDDPLPDHDRVDGNIPIRAALRLIADGDGVASAEAHWILAQ